MDTNNDQAGLDPATPGNTVTPAEPVAVQPENAAPFAGDLNKDAHIDIDADELSKDFSKHEANKKSRSKLFKGLIIFAAVGLLAVLLAVIISVFKLDTAVFPVTMKGTITDYASRPLSGVNVCMQSKCVLTDANGAYSISNLKYGKFTLTAAFTNSKELSEEIDLQRGSNTIDRSLSPLGIGDVNGILTVADNTPLLTKDLSVTFDNQPVDVTTGDRFQIKGKTMGTYTLAIKSPSYIDINASVEVKEGSIDLPAFVLQPAMDVTFKVNDWILGTALSGYSIKSGSQTAAADNNGVVLLKDLTRASNITFDIIKDGYNTKTVTSGDLGQALNELDPFTLVRSGRICYLSTRLGNSNIYTANFDGSDEKMLTDNKGDVFDPIMLTDNKTIAFLSTRDQIQNSYGTVISAPYTVDTTTNKITKLASGNYGSDGLGYFNFQAQKRAFSRYQSEGGVSLQQLYFGSISGSDPLKVLERSSGNYGSMQIANNGSFLIYGWSGDSSDQNGVYLLNPLTNENRKLYGSGANSTCDVLDISADLKSVLIRVTDGSSYNSDLFLVSISGNKTVRLTNTTAYESAARFGVDNNYVYYSSTRDNKTDIFRINLTGVSEQRMTTDGKVYGFRIAPNGLILYTSEQSLYVTDPSVSGSQPKKITDNVTNNSLDMVNLSGGSLGYQD